jgi:uncharacterized membrane protein
MSQLRNAITGEHVSSFGSRHDNTLNRDALERWALIAGGGLLAVYGLKHKNLSGLALAAIGGGLIYNGFSNRGTTRRDVSVAHNQGIHITRRIVINRPPEELYRFWRNLENLPKVMSHLESVQVVDNNRSHWVARGPAGSNIEWDARIINEKDGEMIAWRSVDGADIGNAGSVHFRPSPDGRGTELTVVFEYDPPAGTLGAAVAKLMGEEPEQQVAEDLEKFKQMIESGQVPVAQSQTSGHKSR